MFRTDTRVLDTFNRSRGRVAETERAIVDTWITIRDRLRALDPALLINDDVAAVDAAAVADCAGQLSEVLVTLAALPSMGYYATIAGALGTLSGAAFAFQAGEAYAAARLASLAADLFDRASPEGQASGELGRPVPAARDVAPAGGA